MRRLSAALALLVLVPGCLGGDDDAVSTLSPGPRDPGPAYFHLVVGLAPGEGSAELVRVELDGQPDTVELGPRQLVPGNATLVARVALPDEGVWEDEAQLVLFDGAGERVLRLRLGPWDERANATLAVELSSAALGDLRVISVVGPGELLEERLLPTYGRLLWPGGRFVPLYGFSHTIRVPEAHPILWDGRSARYEIDSDQARWTLDGTPQEPGRALVFEPHAGRHTIVVEVARDDGVDRWVLVPSVWERTTVNATALVPQPRELGREPAPWTGTFEVSEGAYRIQLTVSPAGDTPNADLDLTFFAPSGELIGKGQQVGSMPEVLFLVGRGLEAGTYEVRVVSRDTAAASFTAEFVASY